MKFKEKVATIQDNYRELQQKDVEIQRSNVEIQRLSTALRDKNVILEMLRSDMSNLHVTTSQSLPDKVSKHCWADLKLSGRGAKFAWYCSYL